MPKSNFIKLKQHKKPNKSLDSTPKTVSLNTKQHRKLNKSLDSMPAEYSFVLPVDFTINNDMFHFCKHEVNIRVLSFQTVH